MSGADACGRKPGYCQQKINIRRETKGTKSKAGKRPIGVPEELRKLLKRHRAEQDRERVLARDLWVEKGDEGPDHSTARAHVLAVQPVRRIRDSNS